MGETTQQKCEWKSGLNWLLCKAVAHAQQLICVPIHLQPPLNYPLTFNGTEALCAAFDNSQFTLNCFGHFLCIADTEADAFWL